MEDVVKFFLYVLLFILLVVLGWILFRFWWIGLGDPESSVGAGSPSRLRPYPPLLYCSGLSGRVVAGVLRGLARFSRESVRLWFRRLREAFPRPERKRRSLVAVDETELKLRGSTSSSGQP